MNLLSKVMNPRVFTLAVILLALPALLFSGTGPLTAPPQASHDGGHVVLQWQSTDESNVSRYDIERKDGADGVFRYLDKKSPEGNGSVYVFDDFSAFRTTGSFYQYRVTAYFNNGNPPVPYYTQLTVSSVRRTWGSIKAMFR